MANTVWVTGKKAPIKNGRSYLDGEQCVSLWYQGLNSLQQVANILNAQGSRTKDEGAYISRDAVAKAAWRWIFRNPQEAIKKYIKPGMKARCQDFDERKFWINYVAHLYTSYASPAACRELIQTYHLEEYEQDFLADTNKLKKG